MTRTAYPFELDCSVCGLTLERSNSRTWNMNEPIELDPGEIDPADLYEPDEDLYRDR